MLVGRPWMLVLLVCAVPFRHVLAQEVSFGGQIRPRTEFRDPVGGGNDGFTSMRVRLNVTATLARRTRAFIQVQDVRFWGEETNTLTDFRADNVDLHQGYVEVWSADEGGVGARIGRQEVNFGGQRLVGAVDWTPQGRSFDGARLTARGRWGSVDLIGFKIGESTAPSIDQDAEFVGAYARIAAVAGGALDLYGLYNHRTGDPLGDPSTKQFTAGARLAGDLSGVAYRVEGTYQTGERLGADVAAFMFGVRVGTTLGHGLRGTLWYDYLSGDDDPADGSVKVFDTLFPTNHKYYGIADLFLNIPAHTGGLGLQDFAVKGSYTPRDDLTLRLDIHRFLLAKEGALGSRHLGEEIDASAVHRFSPNLTVTGGASRVFSGAALAALGRLTDDLTFAYLMINATF